MNNMQAGFSYFSLICLVAVFHLIFECQAYAEEESDVTVVSWGGALQDAQREVFFEPFVKETGKKLKEASYNGGLSAIDSMAREHKPAWDLVQVEASDLLLGCSKNYFEVLNWNKIGHRTEFSTGASHVCGAGSLLWAMILAFPDDAFPDVKPQSWADLWDVEKFPGKRGLRKTARFTFEIALLASGVPNTEIYSVLRDTKASEKVFKKLDELYAHIEWWEDGEQPTQWLQTKHVVMSAAYSGRVASAINAGNNFRIVWKNAICSVDYWAILRNSQNKDGAYQLLRSMTLPTKQAEFSEKIFYAPPLKRSYKLLRKTTSQFLPDMQNKTQTTLALDANFWVVAGERLEAQFLEWLKSKTNPVDTAPKLVPNIPRSSSFYPKELAK